MRVYSLDTHQRHGTRTTLPNPSHQKPIESRYDWYLAANLSVFALTTTVLGWLVWEYLPAHWTLKALASFVALVTAAFWSERVASRWVNTIVAKLIRDPLPVAQEKFEQD